MLRSGNYVSIAQGQSLGFSLRAAVKDYEKSNWIILYSSLCCTTASICLRSFLAHQCLFSRVWIVMNKRGEPVYPAAEDAFSVLAEQTPTLLWRLAWYWHEVVVLWRLDHLAWFTQFSHHNSDPPSVVQDTVTVTTCAILCPWPQSVHTEITFLVLSVIYAVGDSHPAAEQAELGKRWIAAIWRFWVETLLAAGEHQNSS